MIVDWLTLIFGAAFTVASVVYASFSVGTSSIVSSTADKKEEADEKTSIAEDGEEEKIQCDYNYSMFHLAFAFGAMYVGMLLSNWSVLSANFSEDVTVGETNAGWVAFGVKLFSVFVATVLYVWVIFAPIILPNRTWD